MSASRTSDITVNLRFNDLWFNEIHDLAIFVHCVLRTNYMQFSDDVLCPADITKSYIYCTAFTIEKLISYNSKHEMNLGSREVQVRISHRSRS